MGDHNETKRRARKAVRSAINGLEALLNDPSADIRHIAVCGENEIALCHGDAISYPHMQATGLQTLRIEIEIFRASRKRVQSDLPKAEFEVGTHRDGRKWCLPVHIDRSKLEDVSAMIDMWVRFYDPATQQIHDSAEYAKQAGLIQEGGP